MTTTHSEDEVLADDTPDPRPGRPPIVLDSGVAAQVIHELEVVGRSYRAVERRCGRPRQWLYATH